MSEVEDFEQHMARVIECTVGIGVDGVSGCTLCLIRGDFTACPTHVGEAAAAAVMQSWTNPIPRRGRRRWWKR